MRGVLITLEGGEGSGKSTLIEGLVAALTARGVDTVATREPGGSPLAEAVRSLVLTPPGGHRWTPMAEALLMNAARADHIAQRISPALADGQVVLSDRYADSTRVYQSIGSGVPMSQLVAMEAIVTASAKPDLTLILDAAPEDLLERRACRDGGVAGDGDVFEGRDLDFHRAVRQGFLDIAAEESIRCVVLNALAEPQRLLERALGAIDQRLKI
ncbi:MAG: dTMP kinase [Pseudomonadota bacterium]